MFFFFFILTKIDLWFSPKMWKTSMRGLIDLDTPTDFVIIWLRMIVPCLERKVSSEVFRIFRKERVPLYKRVFAETLERQRSMEITGSIDYEDKEDSVINKFRLMRRQKSQGQNEQRGNITKKGSDIVLSNILVTWNLIALIRNIINDRKSRQDLAMLHGKIISRYVRTCKIFAGVSRNKILTRFPSKINHEMARRTKY